MVRRTTALPDKLTRLWAKQLYREYTTILHWYDLKKAMAPVALVMYLADADKYFGPLPSRLPGVHQPLMSS